MRLQSHKVRVGCRNPRNVSKFHHMCSVWSVAFAIFKVLGTCRPLAATPRICCLRQVASPRSLVMAKHAVADPSSVHVCSLTGAFSCVTRLWTRHLGLICCLSLPSAVCHLPLPSALFLSSSLFSLLSSLFSLLSSLFSLLSSLLSLLGLLSLLSPLPLSFLRSHFGSRPFSVNILPTLHRQCFCLISQVFMVQQRSWKLHDDWKEVAHSRSSYRNQRRSNNKSSYGWKWRPWTSCCQFEGCRGWVYDHQKRSFCPQCIRPLFEPAPAKSPCVEPMCFPCGENFGNNVPEGDRPSRSLIGCSGQDRLAWEGLSRSLACNQHRASPRRRLRPPKTSWHRRNPEYNKSLRE